MKCLKCNYENPDSAKFCNNCGERLVTAKELVCPNCGFRNPLDSIFCTECGNKLVKISNINLEKDSQKGKADNGETVKTGIDNKQKEIDNKRILLDEAINVYDKEGLLKALPLFIKCIESGDEEAKNKLAELYHFDDKSLRYTTYCKNSFEWHKQFAEIGYADAQYELGKCYSCGWPVAEDEKKAFELYKKAAEQNHPKAQYELGDYYYYGRVVAEDKKKAFELYKKAAEQNHPEAQYKIGDCYYNGWGVAEDKKKAFKWYKKAAEKGILSAQEHLVDCYICGIGVDKDEKKALEWYKKYKKQKDDKEVEEIDIDFILERANNYSYYDSVRSAKYLEAAAEKGSAKAQYDLGECYYNGFGVAEDSEKAIDLITKAAELGNESARNFIDSKFNDRFRSGLSQYKRGKCGKAFKIWGKIAEYGHANAQFHLGICYEYGKGVEKDCTKAADWYTKAAKNGKKEAQDALERIGKQKGDTNTTKDMVVPKTIEEPDNADVGTHNEFEEESEPLKLDWKFIGTILLIIFLLIINIIVFFLCTR